MKKRVVVGMSGGVDSAVAAALLKEQGFDVVGLYMSNWKETDQSGCCTGEQDWNDVQRICDKIGIPYYSVDFSEEYMERVFKLFVDEYAKGRTPNPDVLCNREIKFGAFADFARGLDSDYIATGHYCGIRHQNGKHYLLRAADENKDQTYFLNQVEQRQLSDVLFPLGQISKPRVREIARSLELSVAAKRDSTGVCFIGERNFRNFLSNYIPMKEGDIVTREGTVVGKHKGVYFYTLGQRRGLGIGGSADGNGERWFVLDKDVKKNVLVVSQGEDDVLYKQSLVTEGFNFITPPVADNFQCEVRIKHRQPLQKAEAKILSNGDVRIDFENKQRAIAAGQYAVAYIGEICLGGGVINRSM
jgi:tRNA-specific 2-thiouridylase